MKITVARMVTHRCPFANERDLGNLVATWDDNAGLVELYEFAKMVDSLADEAITHEQFSAQVARYLDATGGLNVEVVTTWRTAGFDVTVTA